MAGVIIDRKIQNQSVSKALLVKLFDEIEQRQRVLHENANRHDESGDTFLYAVIRCDQTGHTDLSRDELFWHYDRAEDIERVIVAMESKLAMDTNRAFGEYIDVRFDARQPANCSLHVSGNDRDWVESSFSSLDKILRHHKTGFGWVRSSWISLIVQLLAVVVGFFLCWWGASFISPKLNVDNAFLLVFLLLLLIYSNVWGHLNGPLISAFHGLVPSIQFEGSRQALGLPVLRWIVGTIIVVVLSVLLEGAWNALTLKLIELFS